MHVKGKHFLLDREMSKSIQLKKWKHNSLHHMGKKNEDNTSLQPILKLPGFAGAAKGGRPPKASNSAGLSILAISCGSLSMIKLHTKQPLEQGLVCP